MGQSAGLIAAAGLGAVTFVVIFTLDGWTRSGYRPGYHPVSALALGERGWLQTVNFVLSGSLIAVGGVAMMLGGIGVGRWWPLGVCLVVLGLGLVASGIFRMDPMRSYPPGAPTGTPEQVSRAHTWHDHAGAVVFFSLPITAAVAALTAPTGWTLRGGSVVAAVATSYLTSRFTAAWEADGPDTGLWQRATLVVGLGWVTVVSLVAMAALH